MHSDMYRYAYRTDGDTLINDAEERVSQVSENERRSVVVVVQSNQGMLVVAGGLDVRVSDVDYAGEQIPTVTDMDIRTRWHPPRSTACPAGAPSA